MTTARQFFVTMWRFGNDEVHQSSMISPNKFERFDGLAKTVVLAAKTQAGEDVVFPVVVSMNIRHVIV